MNNNAFTTLDTDNVTFIKMYVAATVLTAKGDIFTYSTHPDVLTVGADGQFLVADSTQATGLNWSAIATNFSYEFRAPDFYFPNNADWAVNVGAPSIVDEDDNCLTIRAFK